MWEKLEVADAEIWGERKRGPHLLGAGGAGLLPPVQRLVVPGVDGHVAGRRHLFRDARSRGQITQIGRPQNYARIMPYYVVL